MLDLKQNFDVLEKIVINYILGQDKIGDVEDENGNVVDRVKLVKSIDVSYFRDQMVSEIFEVVKKHVNEYGKVPRTKEIWGIMNVEDYDIDKNEFEVVTGYDINMHNKKLLYKYIRGFLFSLNLNNGLQQMMVRLKSSVTDFNKTDEVYDYVRSHVNEMMQVDITDSGDGLDVFEPTAHVQPTKTTMPTGFPFFDKVLGGGWEKGSLIVFQGRPKVGKSLVLGNIGVRACLMGANVCIVSVELLDCKYVKRVGSNILKIPYEEYKNFTDGKSVNLVKEKIEELRGSGKKIGQFKVKEFPTGVPSSIDIENYVVRQESKTGQKFDLVIIDYLNLLRPYKNDATMYEKIKSIAQELRAIGQRNEWTVVSATQVKVADYHADLRLDSVSESSGLTATVDSLFGITGEPGDPFIKIKNIANRDEGYMESWKQFKKVFDYFRLDEDNSEERENEYWSDQLSQLDQEIEEVHNDIHGEESDSYNEVKPNTDFDKQVEYEEVKPIELPVKQELGETETGDENEKSATEVKTNESNAAGVNSEPEHSDGGDTSKEEMEAGKVKDELKKSSQIERDELFKGKKASEVDTNHDHEDLLNSI